MDTTKLSARDRKLPLNLSTRSFLLPLLISVLVISNASASERFTFSGFASIGAGKIDRSDDLNFMDYDGEWSFRNDTMLGLQANAEISDRWSATAQVVSRGFTYDDYSDFEPALDWLFVKYQINADSSTRLGRLRTPLYLYSDTLEIGYSYFWARPPVNTYTFVMTPLTNYDGMEYTTLFDFDDFYMDFTLFGGQTDGYYLSFDLDFKQIIGANFKFHFDDILIRYGTTFAKTDAFANSYQPLIDGYQQLATTYPIFQELIDAHYTENAWFKYHSLGIRWNYKSWTFITEQYVADGPEKGFANDAIGWYVTIAKQIGKFSPYFVAGYYKNTFASEIEELITESETVIPPGFIPELDFARAIDREQAQGFNEKGENYIVGIRYDFHTNAALKYEAQYFNSTALLLGEKLDTKPNETLVTTIVLDVVF